MKIVTNLFVGILALFTAAQANAWTPPTVGAPSHDANPTDPVAVRPPHRMDVGSPVVMTITPLRMSWKGINTVSIQSAFKDELGARLTTDTVVTDPRDYAVCNGRISWTDLVHSVNQDMWAGTLTTDEVHAGERGLTVCALVDCWTTSGKDELSLADLLVTTTSTDNLLNGSISFTNENYSRLALLIKEDGSRINYVDTTNKGNRVLVFVWSPLFNGGDTQAGLDQVRDWVNNYVPGYGLSFTVRHSSGSVSTARVNTKAQPVVVPELSLSHGVLTVAGDVNTSYRIMHSTDLRSWSVCAVLPGGGTYTCGTTGNQFFRAMVQ